MFAAFQHIVDGAYDYQEALTRQDLQHEDVVLLRERVKRSEFVPRFIHDKQLLLFLNARKDDVDRCARWLHTYYKMKRNAPEFFTNRDVYSDEVQTALKDQLYLALPITPDNCNVFLHKLSDFEPRKWIFDATIKTFIMTAEAFSFRNGPRDGTILIYDFEGGRFRHCFQPSISSIRKGVDFLQSGSPLNVKQIHLFNVPYFLDVIFSMIKPIIRRDLFARIHIHQATDDYSEFFKKFIPRSHMPSTYGGDLGTVEELHEQNRKLLYEMNEYFIEEEQQLLLKREDLAAEYDDDFFDKEDKD